MNFSLVQPYLSYFNDGMIITLIISFFTVLFGTLLGVLAAMGKMSKIWPLRWIIQVYLEIFRNTPMLVQISLGFVLLGQSGWPSLQVGVLNEDLGRLIPGILILTLNSGAYMAEIVRAGIEAVPTGQREAAYSLGIRPTQTMLTVILPQAIRNILPAVGNEFVTIVKDSSLLSTIGIIEVFGGAQAVLHLSYQSIAPYLVVAAYYFVVCFALNRLLALYEKRLKRGYVK